MFKYVYVKYIKNYQITNKLIRYTEYFLKILFLSLIYNLFSNNSQVLSKNSEEHKSQRYERLSKDNIVNVISVKARRPIITS